MSNSPAWLHPVSNFSNLNCSVSVAIGIPNPRNPDFRHSGIIFTDSSNEILLLHLGGHHNLSTDSITDYPHFYCVKPVLEEERAVLVNIQCRTISKTRDMIPYGLFFNGEVNFSDIGEVIFSDNVNGLTCATFVLAVFKHSGITLLDLSTWDNADDNRKKEDLIFHKIVISSLEYERKKTGVPSEDYINKIRAEVGCARFRPEEVAGASSYENLPVNFNGALQKGKEIIDTILPASSLLKAILISITSFIASSISVVKKII